MLQDRANLGSKALEEAAMRLVVAANTDPAIAQVFSPFRANSPRLFADVDRAKALMLDVPLENVFSAMQIYLGSVFVNELNLFGRTFRVTAQADPVPRRRRGSFPAEDSQPQRQHGSPWLACRFA